MHEASETAPGASSRFELPNLGVGRHFSWSILDDLDVTEDHRRASFGVRLLDQGRGLLTAEEEQILGRKVRAGTNDANDEFTSHARDAVAQLVLANLRLCIRPARSRLRHGQDFEDIIQNGVRGLIRAAEKFNPEYGNRFSTYAMVWIRQAMDRGVERESRLVRIPSHVSSLQRRLEIAETHGLLDDALSEEEIAKIVKMDVAQVRLARAAIHEILSLDEAEAELRTSSALDPRSFEPDDDDPEVPSWGELVTDNSSPVATEMLDARIKSILEGLTVREQEVIRLYYGLDDFDPETLESIGDQFGLTRERVRQIRNGALDGIRRALAVERARWPGFDVDMNLDAVAIEALTSDDITQHVALVLEGAESDDSGPTVHRRAVDPAEERKRVIRSVLSDLRAATSTWSSGLLFDRNDGVGQDVRVTECIARLTAREPYSRRTLIDTLSELVDDVGPDAIHSGLLTVSQSVVNAALQGVLLDAEGLSRLLRLVRFLGCSTDPLGYELVLRASPRGTVELHDGSRVASTWRFDENNPDHVRRRRRMHRHGNRFGLEWNAQFDDDLDLVIAESLDHRSSKTYSAVLAGVPVCDIETFLQHESGRRLTVLRSPRQIPWTYVCRRCQTVKSHRRSRGDACPTRCKDCSP